MGPLKRKYLIKPLQVCDRGVFYVGGAPKLTQFGLTPAPGATTQIIVGSMYVEFEIPMVSKAWPLIMVHGSGYIGSCVRGTAGGTEGWSDYTVRHWRHGPPWCTSTSIRWHARARFGSALRNRGGSLQPVGPDRDGT
jgi:hypothetical protein